MEGGFGRLAEVNVDNIYRGLISPINIFLTKKGYAMAELDPILFWLDKLGKLVNEVNSGGYRTDESALDVYTTALKTIFDDIVNKSKKCSYHWHPVDLDLTVLVKHSDVRLSGQACLAMIFKSNLDAIISKMGDRLLNTYNIISALHNHGFDCYESLRRISVDFNEYLTGENRSFLLVLKAPMGMHRWVLVHKNKIFDPTDTEIRDVLCTPQINIMGYLAFWRKNGE